MKNKLKLLTGLIVLSSILFTFNHCIMQPPKKNIKKKTTTTQTDENLNQNNNDFTNTTTVNPEKDPVDNNNDNIMDDPGGDPTVAENPIIKQEISMGIKNYEQIYITMAVLTGVDPNRRDIKRVYNDLKTQLPNDNNLKSFIAANQVGVTKIAAEFCHRLLEDSTLRGRIWPTINFGRAPSSELNTQNKNLIVKNMLDKFWGLGVDMAIKDMAYVELNSLINDLLVGENLGSSTTTRNVTKGICIAALSSANITLL